MTPEQESGSYIGDRFQKAEQRIGTKVKEAFTEKKAPNLHDDDNLKELSENIEPLEAEPSDE